MTKSTSWVFLLALALALALASHASATPSSLASWANGAETGAFLMRTAAGRPLVPATLLKTDVHIDVSGPIARVTVRQSFFNQSSDFGEAFYVFPLPESAAVHGMELRVGERRIVGEIHQKEEAKEVYEAAKREGKRAGLVEQTRPNLFTASVANVASGEQVEVVIDYTQKVAMEGDRFDLRFPMTLTPRYCPPASTDRYAPLDLPVDGTPVSGNGVSGPVAMPGLLADHVNRARVTVSVDAGHTLAALESASHDVRATRHGNAYRVELASHSVPMDRDFLLSWQPAGKGSRAAFFSEVVAGENYGLLLLTPPQAVETRRLSREIVFIIDTSGSMGGASIRQARLALLEALRRLQSGDRFNVIEFDDDFRVLFDDTRPVDQVNVAAAFAFVSGLEAGGGTEMLPALTAALGMRGDPEYLRQVVFITDGAVGNENAIFGLLHQRLGDIRLFTVGIGSAPNSYFMRKAAEFGRGTFTYVSQADHVQDRMAELFGKLEKPVLRDVEVVLPAGVQGELWPRRIPDLYAGEPVLVAMKLDRLPDELVVRGIGPAPWQRTVPVTGVGGHTGIATVWARDKIGALMDRLARGESEATLRREIVQVALTHRLVSRYTSFVAVDRTPARPAGSPLVSQPVPNLPPHGFALPQTALGLERLHLYGAICLVAAMVVWRVRMRRRHA